jgi:hypothetical protein
MAFGETLDPDFEARWAAWVQRGLAHDRAVRQKVLILLPVLAGIVATAYLLWS